MRLEPRVNEQVLFLIPLLLYLSLSILYLVVIPVGESPDEPGHLQCIEQVAQKRRLPLVDPEPSGEWWSRTTILSGHMCYHMPLYYVVAGALQLAVHKLGGSPLHFEFPANNPDWGRSPAMFVHEDGWRLAEQPVVTVLRFFSMGLGLVILWATYRAATLVFSGDQLLALGATVVIAGWPQFLYMSRAINNELLAAALAVLVLVTLLDVGRPRRYILAASLASLAMLAKLTAAFAIGVVAITFLVEFFWFDRENRQAYLWPAVTMLLVFLALGLLMALQPTLQYNFLRGLSAFQGVTPAATSASYWLKVTQLTASSGWARFGWMNLAAPAWQTIGWWLFIISGSLWGAVKLRRYAGGLSPLVGVILALWTVAVMASYLRINLNRFQPQFRFAFALLPVLGTFTAAGYLRWFHNKQRLAVAALALLLFVMNVWLVTLVVIPAY